MLLEGQFQLQAPIEKVWESVLDPTTLGSCMPGTEKMEIIDEKTYESIVKQRVGPFKVKLKFKTELTELRPPNYIKAVGKGADVTKLGNFSFEEWDSALDAIRKCRAHPSRPVKEISP
ncbi:MAG: SRPBCC domain-containing protein [Acidobacteriota bacterium]